ncbi:membrane-associated PAP2 superfamily phosphatase [Rhodopseudomonas julia]|uniref:Membrane-associated PAP2 superfamily phosphatase n=1 Tax=Rhodopseudomonas julia TaxID=200617 RepID=A0ABU0C561_9BRAD|nr:phosphatase PAP2 family protein [Rhodopseudomonas julia]MDQ0325647.1 membrane-associated PAP2 superfamily phosphatase [Rhodopseudomonas julia]
MPLADVVRHPFLVPILRLMPAARTAEPGRFADLPVRLPPSSRLNRPVARAMNLVVTRPTMTALTALLAILLVFAAFPAIDLAVARLFFDPAGGFTVTGAPPFWRNVGRGLEIFIGIAIGLPLLARLLWPDRRMLVRPHKPLFLYLVLAIGPGLLVNGLLKTFSGRPRPRHLFEFGGEEVFARVGDLSGTCHSNCSFASGEAASAFWLIALVFVVPKAWRLPVFLATFGLLLIVSWTRLAMGGHFLSDVLVAWLVTFLVMIVLRLPVLYRFQPEIDRGVTAALTTLGRRLRAAGRFVFSTRA